MNKPNIKTVRNIQKVALYTVFATVGFVLFAILLSVAEVYEFPLEKMRYGIAVVCCTAGVLYLILGIYIVLVGSPVAYFSLENPFTSQERLAKHFTVKLNDRHYGAPLVLMDDLDATVTSWKKTGLDGIRIFVIVSAPVLDVSIGERVQTMIAKDLEETVKLKGKATLTILFCVDSSSEAHGSVVKTFGRRLPATVVSLGFDFEKETMSFQGKIDGLATGKPRRALKSFLAMLPVPQNYLEQRFLEGTPRKTHALIVWPFDPTNIPKGIRALWCVSSFALAVLGFLIGMIFISSNLSTFSVIIFVYAFFMIGVGGYQIKQMIVQKNKEDQ